jgi:hypothetical protein
MVLAGAAMAQPASIDLGSIGTPGTASTTFSLTSGLIQWYRFTLTNPISSASNYLDMGTLSNAGTPVNTDTEIGLYRSDGTFVATDDDSGPNQFSQLSFGTGCPSRPSTQPPLPDGVAMTGQNGATLPAGTYYLAVAGFNAVFNATNWSVTTTSTLTGEVRVFLNSDVASTTVPPNLTAGAISQASVRPGQTVLITGTLAVCGAAGTTVTLDGSPLGDSSTVAMFDDATHGDTTANNNVFSVAYTIPLAAAPGPYTLNVNATNANGSSAPRALAVTVVSPATLTGVAGVYSESEDNNTKGQANNVSCFAAGESLTGGTTGTSTTVAGPASADYYRLQTCAAAPAIYLHTLQLTAPTAPTSYACTVRGVSQTAGVSLFDDLTFQTAATANQTVKWYGFGAQEQVLYRVTGTASTTGAYTSLHSVTPISPTAVSSTLVPGTIVIDRDTGNTADIDLVVLDSSFNPVAGFMNDGQNALTRTFVPGTYYVGFSNFNTANNQGSPPDDTFRTGGMLDFANGIANSSTTTIPNLNIRFTHPGGVATATGSKANAFEVAWYQFSVQTPTNPVGLGSATPGSIAITGTTLLRVQVTPAGSPPSTGLAVVGDLTGINGSSTQQFFDDGTHGDVTAGDSIFSFTATAIEPLSPSTVNIGFTVSDAELRSSNGSIPLTLTAAPTGRCCTGSTCSISAAYACTQGGGTYGGNGTDCGSVTYAFSDSANPYATINGNGGTLLPTASNVDDGGDTVTLPFTFNFFGNTYTTMWVCSNGFVQFGGSNSTTFTNVAIPNTGIPNNMICPLWDDYNTINTVDAGAGDVYVRTDGVSPNQTYTVDWSHVTQYRIGAPLTYPQTDENFQVILYEGSNNIEFRYGALNGACNTNIGQCTGQGGDLDDRTVGVENLGGTAGFAIGGATIGTGNLSKMVTFTQASPCVPTTGSCCTSNMCTITSQAGCTGTWSAGGSCPSSCAPHCGSADFNCDGDVGTDADIEGFFACLAGGCPGLPCISSADFNGDGDVGTDGDIEAFFRVLAGGNC